MLWFYVVLLSIASSAAACFAFVYFMQAGLIRPGKWGKPDIVDVRWLLDQVKVERQEQATELEAARKTIEQLKRRIEELESELVQFKRISALPTTPLLLICGDQGFCQSDAAQITKARVWYRVIENATRNSIEDELMRRRQNGDLYPWLHISAHGSEAGILLADGIAEPNWWNRQLEGVKVVLAANCESVEVGDALAGVVDYVIVFYGDRESDYMSSFAYAFWREMAATNDAKAAYKKALIDVPAIRPHVDLRAA